MATFSHTQQVDYSISEQDKHLPNYQSSELPKFQTTKVPNYQSSKPPKFQTTKVPNYQSSKLSKFRITKVPNDQCSELPMFRATKVPSYQSSKLPKFQVTMQPSNLATSSRTEKREPKNKILGAKTSEQKAPNFHFLDGKIDQKSDFWNIVLRCSEREASCTFVGTRLRRPNKSVLPTAAHRSGQDRCFALRK